LTLERLTALLSRKKPGEGGAAASNQADPDKELKQVTGQEWIQAKRKHL